MTNKLEIYNLALLALGERKISSLSENRMPRRVLDTFYLPTVRYCLSAGGWKFATKTVEIEASESTSGAFGFNNAFAKPTDWLRTVRFSDNEDFASPLLEFVEEAGYWFSNCDPLYVRYVSNDGSFGMDLSQWTPAFLEYVAARLALKSCPKIRSAGATKEDLEKDEKKARSKALDLDAVGEAPQSQFQGTLSASRGGRSSTRNSRWDRRSF